MKSKETNTVFGTKKTPFTTHLLFCAVAAVAIYISVNTYAKNITTVNDEEIATAAVCILIGGVYMGRFLSGLFIFHERNVPAWLLILLPLIIIACIFFSVFFAGSLLKHQETMHFIFLAFPLFILSLSSGMFVKLVHERIKRQLYEAQLVAMNSRSELQLLQSQLSPHFLFNTLNNIYGISISQHEKVPNLLLKLSDLLRYSVYESKELYVPLRDEFAYILNYIEFEKMRLEDRLVLTLDIEEQLRQHLGKIAPMLLIIFVENAFKHARNAVSQKIYIDISAKLWQNNILFTVKNSFSLESVVSPSLEKSSGLGLENAKKRLALLYEKEHDLQIQSRDGFYNVMLRLNIK